MEFVVKPDCTIFIGHANGEIFIFIGHTNGEIWLVEILP